MAAALVVAGAGVMAIAESVELTLENGTTITVDADGDVQTLTLEDLYDGEVRTLDAGEREVTVRRAGDQLKVELDGEPIGGGKLRLVDASRVFVTSHESEGDHESKVIVMRSDDGDAGSMVQDIHVKVVGDKASVWHTDDGSDVELESTIGDGLFFFSGADDGSSQVMYRCEETGSTLMVDPERATDESYIDPATGCEMVKVEAQHRIIVKTIEIDDEENN
jgi:hypothetical protein